VHAHTCISSLNPDDEAVDFNGPTVNSLKQTRKADGDDSINNTIPLCLCDKASSHGSCIGRPDQLLPMHISEGDQMLATMTEGENENPLLQQATIQLTTGSACPLPSGNRQKKWLLQENGFYVPVFSEKSSSPFVSSMTHISSDKPERRMSQTWGVVATVIKQQEQLNESQYRTTDNSQVAMDNTLDTISAITSCDDTTLSRFNKAEHDNEYSDTLDTEHDVFDDFKSKGDDPNIDILDSIHIEGSPALRVRIRTLLEKFRSVFATSLPSEPALITPFELTVDKERREQPHHEYKALLNRQKFVSKLTNFFERK
jgi:hypothetical protein